MISIEKMENERSSFSSGDSCPLDGKFHLRKHHLEHQDNSLHGRLTSSLCQGKLRLVWSGGKMGYGKSRTRSRETAAAVFAAASGSSLKCTPHNR